VVNNPDVTPIVRPPLVPPFAGTLAILKTKGQVLCYWLSFTGVTGSKFRGTANWNIATYGDSAVRRWRTMDGFHFSFWLAYRAERNWVNMRIWIGKPISVGPVQLNNPTWAFKSSPVRSPRHSCLSYKQTKMPIFTSLGRSDERGIGSEAYHRNYGYLLLGMSKTIVHFSSLHFLPHAEPRRLK